MRLLPAFLLMAATLLTSCATIDSQSNATAGPAAAGLSWRRFDSFGVSVQVPQGWHVRTTSARGTKGLQITKDPVTSSGFETGLTINLIERATDAEFSAAILQVGDYLAAQQKSCSQVIASSTSMPQGVPTMTLEGVRTLARQPERGLYHTRTIVHIFKPSRKIYMVIFGSPADSWKTEYVTGKKMLNPIHFDA